MTDRLCKRVNWVLIGFILIGAFLRWIDLNAMSDTLYSDEAFNGNDAVSVLQQPRLTPFFDGNHGRESGWLYVLAAYIGVFDAQPVAMRLAATMAGILTLAACYALARELLNERAATWSVGALAVLFWHVHLSRIALRAILMPLLGALAFAFLLRAYRQGRRLDWICGGVWLGLLAYTYLAARAWLGYAALLLVGLILFDARRRKNSLLALSIALVISLPLMVYLVLNPAAAMDRVNEVGQFGLTEMVNNIGVWLQAAFYRGSPNELLNLGNRPIFDLFLGGLFVIGLLVLPWMIRQRWQIAWLLGLALAAVSPSLVTDDAPHPLRAIGLVLPLALIAGAGAGWLEQGAQRLKLGRWGSAIPIGLLAAASLLTYRDAHINWFAQTEVAQYMPYENQLLHFLKAETTPETPIYWPFTTYLPVIDPGIDFRRAYLSPRPLSVFNPAECWVASAIPAMYVTTSDGAAGYQSALARWADATVAITDVRKTVLLDTTFTVLRATPQADWLTPETAAFTAGDQLRFWLSAALPVVAQPGETLNFEWRIQPLRDLTRPYSVFMHLYRQPLDFQAGPISQGDAPLCISYPTNLWQSHEFVLQVAQLAIPPTAPLGAYAVVVGVYDTETGARLPIMTNGATNDYLILGQIDLK
ncbi:MAG: glycosyltransferase family 39 protein [Thermoflexales bacterium]|nr:glycosyltransferase family 39 protein [Thermoflexales bacterium]